MANIGQVDCPLFLLNCVRNGNFNKFTKLFPMYSLLLDNSKISKHSSDIKTSIKLKAHLKQTVNESANQTHIHELVKSQTGAT